MENLDGKEEQASPKKKQDRDWHERRRQQEAMINVCVLDAAAPKVRCDQCDNEGLIFFVQCVREPYRPIVSLCKTCTIERANGENRVHVREAIGPWLPKWWKQNARSPKKFLSENAKEAMKKGRVAHGKG